MEALLDKVEEYRKAGQMRQAEIVCRDILKKDSDNISAWFSLGKIAFEERQLAGALVCFNQILARNPHHKPSMQMMGEALIEQKEYQKARLCFEMLRSLEPENPAHHVNLGITYLKEKNFSSAIRASEKGLQAHPSYKRLLSLHGQAAFEAGLFKKALHSLGLLFEQGIYQFGEVMKYARSLECLGYFERLKSFIFEMDSCSQLNEFEKASLHILSARTAFLGGDMEQVEKELKVVEEAGILGYIERDEAVVRVNAPMTFYKTYLAYIQMVDYLFHFRQSHQSLYVDEGLPVLHAIGESHSFTPANMNLSLCGQDYRVKTLMIQDCQARHLLLDDNRRRKEFIRHMDAIPKGGKVVFVFGEIDCRPGQGVQKHYVKLTEKSSASFSEGSQEKDNINASQMIKSIITGFLPGYVSFCASEAKKRGLSPYFYGVPAVNQGKLNYDEAVLGVVENVITSFNEKLKKEAMKHGAPFIDIYLVTSEYSVKAKPGAHFDSYHVNPTFFQQACNLLYEDSKKK